MSWNLGHKIASTLTRFEPYRALLEPLKEEALGALSSALYRRKIPDQLDTIS
jgi:hypothetical protein